MAIEYEPANLFELSDQDIQVTYFASSIGGDPMFSYRDHNFNCQFSGDEIRSEQTEIGQLLTVILERVLDLRTVTFSLFLPRVNVLRGSLGTHIQLIGITTTTHTSITGHVLGAEKTYSAVTLNGTAQAVSF